MRAGAKIIIPVARFLACFALAGLGGCSTLGVPIVSGTGEVVGGHPKLRQMLVLMENLSRKDAASNGTLTAFDSASIDPRSDAHLLRRVIAGTDDRYRAECEVLFSGESLSAAKFASLVIQRPSSEGGTERRTVPLVWEQDRWAIRRSLPTLEQVDS